MRSADLSAVDKNVAHLLEFYIRAWMQPPAPGLDEWNFVHAPPVLDATEVVSRVARFIF